MNTVSRALHADLVSVIGDGNVHDAGLLGGRDPGFHPDNLSADLAVYPGNTAEVAAVVGLCARHDIPIVPQGGLTGLSGGAASNPENLIVGLRRMNRIEALDAAAATVIVEAGATLQSVEEVANRHGLSVGIDIGARGSATIGGMIATNAGGMEAFRNGSMRARLLGLEVVTATGAILNDMTEVPKCNEGYDLKHLFCGAEGTLGIITRAVLSLKPMTASNTTLMIAVDDAKAALAITRSAMMLPGLEVLQAEIMWRNYAHTVAAEIGLSQVFDFADAPAYLLLELNGDENALEPLFVHEAIRDAIMARNERERAAFWRIREESFIVDRVVPNCRWYDISVPLGRIDETVRGIEARLKALDPDMGIWVMGHLADGNLHYTIGNGQPVAEAHQAVIADAVYGGLKANGSAFSAEHGIGTEKRGSLAKHTDPEKLRLMHAIKQALDPQGIMNPGKVL